jgi:hypothetical protein
MTKPEANGNATRWHGYAARDGFGITLMRNHIRANSPAMEGSQNSQRLLPVAEFPDDICFLPEKNGITPTPL